MEQTLNMEPSALCLVCGQSPCCSAKAWGTGERPRVLARILNTGRIQQLYDVGKWSLELQQLYIFQ